MTKDQKQRMEQDGLFFEDKEHWEVWETTIYNYYRKGKYSSTYVMVPMNIFNHLQLKHKQKILVAIQKIEDDFKHVEPTKAKVRSKRVKPKTVSLINVCHYKEPCDYKRKIFNIHHHNSKKSLVTCTFDGTCSQKETLTTQEASHKYGIPKHG
jgi:hypothetical protein